MDTVIVLLAKQVKSLDLAHLETHFVRLGSDSAVVQTLAQKRER